MSYEEKIKQLRLVLPPAPKPVGSYCPAMVAGQKVYLSGQLAKSAEGKLMTGKVGKDLTLEDGKAAARLAALNVLSVIRNEIGFERFDRVLHVVGYVQAVPGFYDIPQVINGASDLFAEVFGEKGVHARSAVGVTSLPLNSAVEIEVEVQIK